MKFINKERLRSAGKAADYFRVISRCIGDDFAQMIVVCTFKLIFNDNFST